MKAVSCIFPSTAEQALNDPHWQDTPKSVQMWSKLDGVKPYMYKCLDDNVKEGDFAVVWVESGTNVRLKVVKIVGVSDETLPTTYKTVICTFNLDKYKVDLANVREIEEIKVELRKRRDAVREDHELRVLAGMDTEALALYNRMKELQGGEGLKVIGTETTSTQGSTGTSDA